MRVHGRCDVCMGPHLPPWSTPAGGGRRVGDGGAHFDEERRRNRGGRGEGDGEARGGARPGCWPFTRPLQERGCGLAGCSQGIPLAAAQSDAPWRLRQATGDGVVSVAVMPSGLYVALFTESGTLHVMDRGCVRTAGTGPCRLRHSPPWGSLSVAAAHRRARRGPSSPAACSASCFGREGFPSGGPKAWRGAATTRWRSTSAATPSSSWGPTANPSSSSPSAPRPCALAKRCVAAAAAAAAAPMQWPAAAR